MSHLGTTPEFVDNGAGRCIHCGKTAVEHDPDFHEQATIAAEMGRELQCTRC